MHTTLPRTLTKLAPLLALPAVTAFAQDPAGSSGKWTADAGVAVIDSPDAGEGPCTRPFPLANHDGKRMFARRISGGVHLHQSQQFTLDAIGSSRCWGDC